VPPRRVHLHVGRSSHPVYREQLLAAPDGVAYTTAHPDLEDPSAPTRLIARRSDRRAALRDRAEPAALRVLSEAGYVRADRVRPPAGTDVIHSAELLLRDSPRPYVVDFEAFECFVLYQRAALGRPWARRRLLTLLEDPACHALLPWSAWAARGVAAALGPAAAARLAAKTVVVPPAIRPAVERPRERASGPLRVLFVGTKFVEKGGAEALAAVARARESHDVVLDLVSYVPSHWRARAGAPGVKAHVPGGRDVVEALYARADIFLFPSHMDTFGYVVLEANAHGLPVVAPAHQSLPELVDDGRSGLLVAAEEPLFRADGLSRFRHVLPPPRSYLRALEHPSPAYVDRLAGALTRLAEDPGLQARLADEALARVRDGRFSIGRRRELLAPIYEAAADAA
jgi:glycosyltransferase involved in cell wall biosynthesis